MAERTSLHLSAEAKEELEEMEEEMEEEEEELEGLGVKVTLRFSRRMGHGGSSRLLRKGRRW